jgi:hypothetical protein
MTGRGGAGGAGSSYGDGGASDFKEVMAMYLSSAAAAAAGDFFQPTPSSRLQQAAAAAAVYGYDRALYDSSVVGAFHGSGSSPSSQFSVLHGGCPPGPQPPSHSLHSSPPPHHTMYHQHLFQSQQQQISGGTLPLSHL